MGEILVEIMRPKSGQQLYDTAEFLGPFPSGAPAIFIDTVARLGHRAGIIGAVAEDDFGFCVLERLRRDGVDLRFVEHIPNQTTAVAFVTYFKDGSRKFIFHIDGTPAVMARFPEKSARKGFGFFHVMGCSLMANTAFRNEIFKAIERFHDRGFQISFDPNIRPELLGDLDLIEIVGPVMERCAVLLPGEAELKLLSDDRDLDGAITRLFERPALKYIILKRGKEGATVYTREGAIDTPCFKVQEIDPTGAGDCFDAGFLCGLLEGKSLLDCGKMASAAGALNAAAFGPMEGDISQGSIRRLIGD